MMLVQLASLIKKQGTIAPLNRKNAVTILDHYSVFSVKKNNDTLLFSESLKKAKPDQKMTELWKLFYLLTYDIANRLSSRFRRRNYKF